MGNPIYVIAYDVGTTGVKTCLFSITDKSSCSELQVKDTTSMFIPTAERSRTPTSGGRQCAQAPTR